MVVFEFTKNFIQLSLWGYSDVALFGNNNDNDIGILVVSISNIITYEGFAAFLRVSFAQLWYLGIASFLLVYAGIYFLAKESFLYIVSLIKRKDKKDIDFSLIFIFMGFATTFLVSVLFTYMYGDGYYAQNLERSDGFFYGRYNSLMFLPLTLYALKTIIEKRKNLNLSDIIPFAIIIMFFLLQSMWVSSYFLHHLSENYILYVSVVNYVLFESIINCSIAIIFGFVLLCVGIFYKKRVDLLSLMLFFIIFINIYSSYYLFK